MVDQEVGMKEPSDNDIEEARAVPTAKGNLNLVRGEVPPYLPSTRGTT
jgi:hypothetical protein